MKRLLILSCSQRKRGDAGLLPAVARYDGPQFRVLRKFLREQPDEALAVYILSAQFGLISAEREIPNYDHKMTQKRAEALQPKVLGKFNQILQEQAPAKLFIGLGKIYWPALTGYHHLLPDNLETMIATGSQGRRQADLRTWLHNGHRDTPQTAPPAPRSKVRLRGVEIALTAPEILQIARQKLTEDGSHATSYQAWYVAVDDVRVAPKWLVSQVSGLPVSAFHTGDAQRVLRQLGIEVKRC